MKNPNDLLAQLLRNAVDSAMFMMESSDQLAAEMRSANVGVYHIYYSDTAEIAVQKGKYVGYMESFKLVLEAMDIQREEDKPNIEQTPYQLYNLVNKYSLNRLVQERRDFLREEPIDHDTYLNWLWTIDRRAYWHVKVILCESYEEFVDGDE